MEVPYRAAWGGDEQALGQLLKKYATILVDDNPSGRQTPLHISALLGHLPFTDVLLRHNHDLVFREDSYRRTALHLASAEGHIDIVKELLQVNNQPCLVLLNRNSDLATRKDASGRTALHLASVEDNMEAVQRLLEFNDEPCLAADGEERIPLHYAAMRGRTEFVEALTLQALVKLDHATANVTVGTPRAPFFTLPDHMGNTILHLAVMHMPDEAVHDMQYDKKSGGDEQDYNKPSPYKGYRIAHEHYYLTGVMANQENGQACEQMNRDPNAVYRAALYGEEPTLQRLLAARPTLLANIPDRETPLDTSARLGHVGFTQILLNHNHNLAIRKDSSGRTALHSPLGFCRA
ncbi:inversin-B-like [Neltuma alba]|uniref:inversin-B-like n=1 Tax=Neltuma alba TaxID=207710 RepID=UPI0010A444E9|nr:inversin-B-like [Prosopis alba]